MLSLPPLDLRELIGMLDQPSDSEADIETLGDIQEHFQGFDRVGLEGLIGYFERKNDEV